MKLLALGPTINELAGPIRKRGPVNLGGADFLPERCDI